VQTDPNGLLFMRARYYNPYICRFLNADPSGFDGGLNFFLFCNDNPINAEDPFGLYGYSTMYWANLSVTGSWWQKAIAVPLGVLSATVPDAVAVSVNGTAGFGALTTGTVGVQNVWQVQQGGQAAAYSFAALGSDAPNRFSLLSPQVSVGISFSIAWSSDYNPNPSTWTGQFSEANVGVGVFGGNGFKSDTWTGVGAGFSVGPVPYTASYFKNVDYQFLTPQGNNNTPQGQTTIPGGSPNMSPTGK